MATEYHQLPSQQGKMPLDLIADSDPWLIAATNNLSLTDNSWSPKNNLSLGLEAWGTTSPSVILPLENGGKILSTETSWNSLSLSDNGITNNKTKLNAFPNVPKNFVSTSSKIDAWSIQAPSPAKQQKVPKQIVQQIQIIQQEIEEESDEAVKAIEDELALQNRYKTELCKSYTETGVCRYGAKCQFAHGKEEVRPILRHPKYKTETCKTFHSTGTCPYGIRCRFIHTRVKEEAPLGFEDDSKVIPPPGIPAPNWSKSWTSAAVIPQKKSSKKHGLGKIPLVEAVPDF